MMASITFFDQEGFRGAPYEVRATGDQFEVATVPSGSSTAFSIYVEKGTWLVYSRNNFMGASFLLKPGGYPNVAEIKKMAQTPTSLEKWRNEIRSLRLITPDSLMLFDDDYFRGADAIIKQTTQSIENSDSHSLIIESATGSTPAMTELDLVFVIDGSGSISATNFGKVMKFAADLSLGLDISPTTTRVGMAQYSSNVAPEFMLKEHTSKGSVEKAINKVKQRGGGTNTGLALEFVRTQMDWKAPPTKRVAIVVTDGQSGDNVDTPAKALRQSGVVVYAVGVGLSTGDLNVITGDPSKVYALNNHDELEKIVQEISNSLAQVAQWMLYQFGRFYGKDWEAFPGCYTKQEMEQHIGTVGSAKRIR